MENGDGQAMFFKENNKVVGIVAMKALNLTLPSAQVNINKGIG
jgi:hypothetical protein